MKVTIGCDHRGFGIKRKMIELLTGLGHVVQDCGSFTEEYSDYPDYAFAVSEKVGKGESDRGILICGTSIGMCIAANKVCGVRAASCHDLVTTEMSRRHNDANILCLSADLLGEEMMERIIRLWLETAFEGGRHARRVDKIMKYEAEHKKA
jgi:ribose 5-phosphate isomerase B